MKKGLLCTLLLTWLGCSKPGIPDPVAVALQTPDNLESCTTAFTVNADQSQVTFRWSEALHTDSYELVVENSRTGKQIKETTALTTVNVVLDKGHPYRWWVISLSEASLVETASETWQFYLEGLRSASHVPFSAHLLSPENGALRTAGPILFQWEGSDLDNDSLVYDFYLGTDPANLDLKVESSSEASYTATLSNAGTYYWKVESTDPSGNRSSSVFFTLTIQ